MSWLRNLFIEDETPPAKAVPLASTEGIKLVFDVVRNYTLCLLVFGGAGVFANLVDRTTGLSPAQAGLLVSLKWALFGLAGVLLLLNALFATYVFELTPFYQARSAKFRWAAFSVVICTAFGTLLCLAIYLGRTYAKA